MAYRFGPNDPPALRGARPCVGRRKKRRIHEVPPSWNSDGSLAFAPAKLTQAPQPHPPGPLVTTADRAHHFVDGQSDGNRRGGGGNGTGATALQPPARQMRNGIRACEILPSSNADEVRVRIRPGPDAGLTYREGRSYARIRFRTGKSPPARNVERQGRGPIGAWLHPNPARAVQLSPRKPVRRPSPPTWPGHQLRAVQRVIRARSTEEVNRGRGNGLE